jgi:hypothetical protein
VSRAIQLGLAVLVAAAVSSCGSPALWARYQAEQRFWHARRVAERAQIDPKALNMADLERAQAAFTAIARKWPAAEWAKRDRLGRRYGSDVARLSGESAIAAAKIAEARGQLDSALTALERTEREYETFLPVRLEAALERAAMLQRAGDPRAEIMAESIARNFPFVDPSNGQALEPVLGALIQVVQDHVAHQRIAAVDSALRASVVRTEQALANAHGTKAAPALWLLLAQLHAARGVPELAPALASLRGALAEPEAKKQRPELVLLLAKYAFAGGQRDTALAYARWGQTMDRKTAQEAILLRGQIWSSSGWRIRRSPHTTSSSTGFLRRSMRRPWRVSIARSSTRRPDRGTRLAANIVRWPR